MARTVDPYALTRSVLSLGRSGTGLLSMLGRASSAGNPLFSADTLRLLGQAGSGLGALNSALGLASIAGSGDTGGSDAQKAIGALGTGLGAVDSGSRFLGMGGLPYAGTAGALLGLGSVLAGGDPAHGPGLANALSGLGTQAGAIAATTPALGGIAGLSTAGASAAAAIPLALMTANLMVGRHMATPQQARRSRDAGSMQSGILGALGAGDLNRSVGGVPAGETLASILNSNAAGGTYEGLWGWGPDPSLVPLRESLGALGYRGNTAGGSTRDVNSFGEMIAGAGKSLLPANFGSQERLTTGYALSPHELANMGGTPTGLVGGYSPWSPALGAKGWEHALRSMSGVSPDAPSLVPRPNPMNPNEPGLLWDPNPAGTYAYTSPEGWGTGYTPPTAADAAPAAYLSLLDPATAASVQATNQARANDIRAMEDAWRSAP